MSCSRLSEENCGLLLEYSAGRLDELRKVAVETHLQACQDCVAFLTEQAALWTMLDEWEPQPVSVDFNRRLWQQIDEKRAAGPWYTKLAERLHIGSWKPVAPLAAAAIVVVTGFVFDHRASAPVPAPGVVVSSVVSSVDAEQAERTLDDLQLLKQLDTVAARPM